MIFRSKHRQNFTLVENAAIRDPRLSLRATGLLAFLLSYPDDTSFSREKIRRMKPDGVRGIRSALIELGQAGYLVHEYTRDKWGRWRTETFVYETPQGSGDAFRVPDRTGATGANSAAPKLARIAPTTRGRTGAGSAKNGLQSWRVSDGGNRATNYLKNEYQDATPTTDPQGVVVVANCGTPRDGWTTTDDGNDWQRPALGIIPDAPPTEIVAGLRRSLHDRMTTTTPDQIQQELL